MSKSSQSIKLQDGQQNQDNISQIASPTNGGQQYELHELPLDQRPNKISSCTMPVSNILAPELLLFSIKNQRLQHIYNEEKDELEKSFADVKKVLDNRTYKYEVLIAFWITVHLQKLEAAKLVYDLDPIIEKMVTNLRSAGQYLLDEKKRKEEETKKKSMMGFFSKSKQNNPQAPQTNSNSNNTQQNNGGLSPSQPATSTDKEKSIPGSFSGEAALYRMENKNELLPPEEEDKKVSESDEQQQQNIPPGHEVSQRYSHLANTLKKKKESKPAEVTNNNQTGIYTIDDLIDLKFLLQSEVAIPVNTNIMRIALNFLEEKIASLIVAYYKVKIDEEMILRAIKTGQLDFLYCVFSYNRNFQEVHKEDANEQAQTDSDEGDMNGLHYKIFTFDLLFKKVLEFCEDQATIRIKAIVHWKIKSTGTKTELVLNTLIFADFSRWSQVKLRVFIDFITEIVKRGHEQNRILLCYNPIQVITLSCEFLTKIGKSISIFRQEGKVLSAKLLGLGRRIIDNMDEEVIPKVFLDIDFKDRTVLKIITSNGYVPLMQNEKVSVLLEEIWVALFKQANFADLDDDARSLKVKENIDIYNQFNYYGTLLSATLFLHVITKQLFNIFAEIKMPYDKWTIIDIMAAFMNLICFNLVGNVTEQQILDQNQKKTLDYYVIIVILLSWTRFFMYFLVVKPISKLLMILIRVVLNTMTFNFIMFSIVIINVSIFQLYFQETSPLFYNLAITFRTLFDALIGTYAYLVIEDMALFSIFQIIHIFITKIVLVNFLVAILESTFKEMQEQGNFAFQVNQYQFIERYSIAMQDEWGYSQLVILPPPINFFTIFLIPTVMRKGLMKRASEVFSKFIFWFENMFYLMIMLIYLLMLVPLIYLRMIYNIVKLASVFNLIWLLSLWLLFGPIFLIQGVGKDMFYFMKTLCDYKDENDQNQEKEAEDFKQDLIVLYNEILEVMRAILQLFKERNQAHRRKRLRMKKKLMKSQTQRQKHQQENNPANLKRHFLDDDLEEDDQGFTITKELIIEAWSKWRPSSSQQNSKLTTPDQSLIKERQKNPNKSKDARAIFGDIFMAKLLSGIKMKNYNQKKEYKPKEKQMGTQNGKNKNEFVNNFTYKLKEQLLEEENEQKMQKIPKDELQIMQEFLNRFLFVSDTSSKESMDLKLSLKSLPFKVNDHNVYRIGMIHFNMIQKSLIAFQNDDQDELFRYYDNRNKTRYNKLNVKASETKFDTQNLRQLGSSLLSILNKINFIGKYFKNTNILNNAPAEFKKFYEKKRLQKVHPEGRGRRQTIIRRQSFTDKVKDQKLPPIHPKRNKGQFQI
ncbi:UNKNOWN [Stylonychia lemnae]|uniref:Uncharacterized protein n=1 Tax=Stylonychia lemnae TaxID=5949 RepID=A0A077ZTS7_STYLE|nr:UNKNOWN [Stylonychia lemnae]|eukprot:CDW71841.1 UNKNOWN [Stylonychia lemnae]